MAETEEGASAVCSLHPTETIDVPSLPLPCSSVPGADQGGLILGSLNSTGKKALGRALSPENGALLSVGVSSSLPGVPASLPLHHHFASHHLSSALSWGPSLPPPTPDSRWGKVLAAGRSSESHGHCTRARPRGRSAPARGSGMGRAGRLPAGRSGPSGAASSRPRPPRETRVRGSQGCARVSPARASRGGRRASQARPWAATRSRCQQPLPGTEPGERASELRRGTGWGPRGGGRGDGRALPAQMAGPTGDFQAGAPFSFPGVSDSGRGTPKWPPTPGLLRPPAPRQAARVWGKARRGGSWHSRSTYWVPRGITFNPHNCSAGTGLIPILRTRK